MSKNNISEKSISNKKGGVVKTYDFNPLLIDIVPENSKHVIIINNNHSTRRTVVNTSSHVS